MSGGGAAAGSSRRVKRANVGATPAGPTLQSAIVQASGNRILLTFNANMNFGSAGPDVGWSVNASGGPVTIYGISGVATTLFTYGTSRVIQAGETVTISYAQPGNGVESYTSPFADIASFSDFTVTNSSVAGGGSAPTPVSASVNSAGTSLTLIASQSVVVGSGGPGGLTLAASGGAVTLSYAGGGGSVSKNYSTSRVIENGETLTLSYTQPGNGIETTTGGVDMASFSGLSVTNNVPGGGGVLTANVTASHLSGPAPLGVLFDATQTVRAAWDAATVFRRCFFEFGFDDPTSGTWDNGDPEYNSKNSDSGGPLAYHTFNTPGTYICPLTVTDGLGNTATTSVTVTVTDPDADYPGTNTVCVRDTGTGDTGGPSGCVYQSTTPADCNGKRILFRQGQSTPRTIPNLTGTQGAYFGSYGTGAKPVINDVLLQHNGTNRVVLSNLAGTSSARLNLNCSNVLVHEVDLTQGTQNETIGMGTTGSGGFQYLNIFIAECSIIGPNRFATNPGYGMIGSGRRFAFVGNYVSDIYYHDVRVGQAFKSVMRHNTSTGRQHSGFFGVWKIQAQSLVNYVEGVSSLTAAYATQFLVIAENLIGSDDPRTNYRVSLGPQNTEREEQVDDCIVENNSTYGPNALDYARVGRRILFVNNRRVGNSGAPISYGQSAPPYPVAVAQGPYYFNRST